MRASDSSKCDDGPREKYVFLVRHAQSTWNQNVEMVKTFRDLDFGTTEITLKDVVSRAAHLMARDAWHKDHPISGEGLRQTAELRRKITAMRQDEEAARALDEQHCENRSSSSGSSSRGSASPTRRSEREKRFYDRFLMQRQQIYCSPLLRALQTAHLALPAADGFGSIKLLKDAREQFRLRIERDCVGARGAVGTEIMARAMRMGQELPGLDDRVDASDCQEKWWSDEPETDGAVEARLKNLWRRILDEDGNDSAVLVTHSNLIKALMMHFGGVDDDDEVEQASVDVDADQCRNRSTSNKQGSLQEPADRLNFGGSATVAESWRDSWKEAWRSLSAESKVKAAGKEAPDYLSTRAPDSVTCSDLEETSDPWQVVARSSETLRPLKTERLQNCGVLGLRCVLESPPQRLYPEVDGWVLPGDLDDSHTNQQAAMPGPRWVARDALLMFDSVLVK